MLKSNSPALTDKSKPIILALGSGSLLSMAASVALLRVVEQHGLAGRVRQVWGCSAGAIVGSLYALGMSPDDIYTKIMRLRRRDLVDYNWTGFLSAIFTGKIKGGLLYGRKMLELCHDWLGNSRFEDTKIPFRVLAHRLEPEPEQLAVFSSGEIYPAVAASFAMPGLVTALCNWG